MLKQSAHKSDCFPFWWYHTSQTFLQVSTMHVFINKGQMFLVLAVSNQGNKVSVMNSCQVLNLKYQICNKNISFSFQAFISFSFQAFTQKKNSTQWPTSAENSLSPRDVFEHILTAIGLPFSKYPRKTAPNPPLPIFSLKLAVMSFNSLQVNCLFSNIFDLSRGLGSLELFVVLVTTAKPHLL